MSASHRHAHHDEPKCVEINEHVCLQPIDGGGEGIFRRDEAGELVPVPRYFAGFIISHDRDGFEHRCEGFVRVALDRDGPVWTMSGTLEGGDLTLSPSILCVLGTADGGDARCGFHGFVQGGKWVAA